jgi:hypothetical protein
MCESQELMQDLWEESARLAKHLVWEPECAGIVARRGARVTGRYSK